METSASDMNGECLVTDLVHELSSGLEIPFLLEVNVSQVGKTENADVLNSSFYEEPRKESWSDDLYLNFANSGNELNIKKENNELDSFFENSNIDKTYSTSCFSGSRNCSGSDSSSDLWSTKIELDTPPITPPDERISPDNVFVLPSDEFKFIPICANESPHSENNVNNIYKSVKKRVKIQPKPVPTSLNVIENQPLDIRTVTFNVFSDANSNNLTNENIVESNVFLSSNLGKKKSSLTKKDLELLQAKRRQERMIRNRESAYLSRKRKKEHVAHLEKQVQDLQAENKQLKLENCSLRQRLSKYEKLEPSSGNKSGNLFTESPRKTTALLALLFTVCINIGSFSSLMNEKRIYKGDIDMVSENVFPNYPSELRHTRSLLWTHNDLGSLNSSYANLTKTSCPLFVNQSESIRLESELRRWIHGDEDYSRQAKYNVSNISQYFYLGERTTQRKNVSRRKQRVLRSNYHKKNLEMDMYQMNVLNFNSFFEAIHRRDDTFYLVSFSSDHLLLPALSHNQTSRPKMSLMLPAFLSNGTGAAQVEMMQIDCEVTNTQLLSVNENDIPSHMRPYTNSTSKTSKSKSKPRGKNFEEYLVGDLPVTLVPAENITFKMEEKIKWGFANSSGNRSSIFPHDPSYNISKSSKLDFQESQSNFTESNGNNEIVGRRSPYVRFTKTKSVFSNQTYKQDQNAVEFIPRNGRNFLKLLGVGLINSKATKFNPEKGFFKSYKKRYKISG